MRDVSLFESKKVPLILNKLNPVVFLHNINSRVDVGGSRSTLLVMAGTHHNHSAKVR